MMKNKILLKALMVSLALFLPVAVFAGTPVKGVVTDAT